jgi:hypothetical protein
VWPIAGYDDIKIQNYKNKFLLWPFLQSTERFMGTPEFETYKATPFPLYIRKDTAFSYQVDLLWPFVSYYEHYKSGFKRYTFRPFFTYGTGGGREELSIFYLYSSSSDRDSGTSSSSGYVSIVGDEVVTESKFLLINKIRKRFKKGQLVYARYRFWPFAEYTWDLEKGTHFKFPEIIPLNSDWWDINLGHYLRFVDIRDTPFVREISMLFGLSKKTEVKNYPTVAKPPKPGDDGWSELIMGSFGKN